MSTLTHHSTGSASKAIRQLEEIRVIQIGKKEVKLSLFADYLILYIVAGYKKSTQKSISFLYTNNELSEKETKKTIPFTIVTKNNVPRNKFNQGGKRPLLRKL